MDPEGSPAPMTVVLRIVFLTLSVVVASYVCQALGLEFHAETEGSQSLLMLVVAAVLFAVINATLGSILRFLTLPLTCLTLGLFSLVINALMLMLVANIVPVIKVGNFWAALVASIVISIVNGILQGMLPSGKDTGGD